MPERPVWTGESAERLKGNAGVVWRTARKGKEEVARERGDPRITGAVMDEARAALGM